MDPPIISETSFSAANPSAYSLTEIWPFGMEGGNGLGLKMSGFVGADVSVADSTVTEQSNNGGRGKKDQLLSTCSAKDLNKSNVKRTKLSGSGDENGGPKSEIEANSETENKPSEQNIKPSEPPKQDYIHVRARRGQATDSHSLAERARREKISERMKILQDLVPGCNKVIGKALVLDEIINYIQSLQRQVEFLSMKLEAVNSRMSSPIEGFSSKDLGASTFDAAGILFGSQAVREYMQASQPEWLHMQLGSTFDRPT